MSINNIFPFSSNSFSGCNSLIEIDLPELQQIGNYGDIAKTVKLIAKGDLEALKMLDACIWSKIFNCGDVCNFICSGLCQSDIEIVHKSIIDFYMENGKNGDLIYCLPFFHVIKDLMQFDLVQDMIPEKSSVKPYYSFGKGSRNKSMYFCFDCAHISIYKQLDYDMVQYIGLIHQTDIVMWRENPKREFAHILADFFEKYE